MPDRPHAHRGAPFETLLEALMPDGPARGGTLPPDLGRYGPHLAVSLRPDRPTVILNFVESLDGVVTVDPEHGSGAEISGFNEPDRFVMGLLRAMADAIVVGAGTLRSAPNHAWTAGQVNRSYAEAYAAWRRDLGLAPQPTTLVVTGSGDIPTGHHAFSTADVPAVVVTTAAGAHRLAGRLPGHVRIVASGDAPHVRAATVVNVARAEGAQLILNEGGPHLNASFVEARLIDELFLTLAPQLVGRAPGEHRLGLLEGIALDLDGAPWSRLRSVRRSVDHLFLRYAFADD